LNIAIHQPNFIPWIGYFMKIASSHRFVFHDNVEYTKSGFTRRTRIFASHTPEHTQWLTVPLRKHSDSSLIKDLEVSQDKKWIMDHLQKIKAQYSKTEYFTDIFPVIRDLYAGAENEISLSKLNMNMVKKLTIYLGIQAEFFISSELPVSGKSGVYNLNLAKHLGGTAYISGKGGQNYQDNLIFAENDITLENRNFQIEAENMIITKGMPPFNTGLSILHALMVAGPENTSKLIHQLK